MSQPRLVRADSAAGVYRLSGSRPPVYVATHRATRELLCRPELVGEEFTERAREALVAAFSALDRRRQSPLRPPINHVVVLRGGLNFTPHTVEGEDTISFLGVRRLDDGAETDYERWELTDGATVQIGDIAATGGTLLAVLGSLREKLRSSGRRLARLRIGGFLSAESVRAISATLEAEADLWGEVELVALERLFRLPSSAQLGENVVPFDFLRTPAPTAPEFVAAYLEHPTAWFEKCAIYDGGARATTPAVHLEDLRAYWRAIAAEDPAGVASLRNAGWAAEDLEAALTASGLTELLGEEQLAALGQLHRRRLVPPASAQEWRSLCWERVERIGEFASAERRDQVARIIDKVAFVHCREGRVLSSRSRGRSLFYLPGGKREAGESDLQTLRRELDEELGIALEESTIRFVGVFQAQADSHAAGTTVKMTCYDAEYVGEPTPNSEIEEVAWLSYADRDRSSPVDRLIFDHLSQKGLLS